MKNSFCPGSSDFKQPKPESLKCPGCGGILEIWTDEIKVTCKHCNREIIRDSSQASCLDWCKHASDCVGKSAYENYMKNKGELLKENLIKELEAFFGEDIKRINHAKRVMAFAQELLRKEGADWHIVIPASILHDVGIKIAELKFSSSSGAYQEKEGPDAARKILLKLGAPKEHVDEICAIIAHHHSPGIINTLNFKVLYDADWLVNLKDEAGTDDKNKLQTLINKVFLTQSGKAFAEKIYLKERR